jgi:hypothetical protein
MRVPVYSDFVDPVCDRCGTTKPFAGPGASICDTPDCEGGWVERTATPCADGPQNVLRTLPAEAADRKKIPIVTGVLDYFPLALVAIAQVSQAGNDQHNPGQPLHWARGKSTDHADCLVRHLIQRGTVDDDGQRHMAKAAWRALALLQEEIERDAGFTPEAE